MNSHMDNSSARWGLNRLKYLYWKIMLKVFFTVSVLKRPLLKKERCHHTHTPRRENSSDDRTTNLSRLIIIGNHLRIDLFSRLRSVVAKMCGGETSES